MKTEIQIGDFVVVNFNNAQHTLSSKAEVLYMPCQAGDHWHFRDAETGQLHYVSEGCTLTLLSDE